MGGGRSGGAPAGGRGGKGGSPAAGRRPEPPYRGAACGDGGALLGVDLRTLFPPHPVPAGWYAGKRIAIDGHNLAFRYLTSLRAHGDLLRNPEGRAIGHVIGFLNLVRHLRSLGAEPTVVWDGEVHPRKEATVAERVRRRQEAFRQAQAAREAGDEAAYARLARAAVRVTPEMIEDATQVLSALGVAVVRADHDGERYAAALCRAGHADAVASEDFDTLVAGAPTMLRRVGGPDAFLHRLEDAAAHGLDQAQLRHVAILCGTDWHPGVRGIGPRLALEAVKAGLPRLFEEAAAGRAPTRLHRLVGAGSLDWQEFQDLDRFIADLPAPPAPRAPPPDPVAAVAVAEALGVGRSRVLGCFC